ncbi:hypothetical protein [Methanoculleus chikugoensis]|uniref:hypothetical protein n=1 Tax=Methanoculleus chikugoensis TaxID=118126 RepID=UPI0006D02060|nr:hypothetical protein [Methanoculleus chikugoensis]
MSVTTRSLLPPALLAAVLLLPANIYAIGNAVGAGLRFPPLFLYQDTTYGASLIPVWREISYVTSGIIGGRSALSILLWVLGTALLIAAIVYFVANRHEDYEAFRKLLALLVSGGAVAYLLSCVAQYGLTLYGPAGFAVPVGVPLILAVAGYIMTAEEDDKLEEEEEEGGDYGERWKRNNNKSFFTD